jgi:hypothetical protein
MQTNVLHRAGWGPPSAPRRVAAGVFDAVAPRKTVAL